MNSSSNSVLGSLSMTSDNGVSFRLTSLLWMAGITLLMVPMATLFDVTIARWFASKPLPEFVGRILDLSVYYAQGSGVFLMLTAVILLMPRRRWCVPRLATLAMGAGAVATLAKMFVLRPRPNSLYLDAASYDYAWIWSFDWTLSQVATFDASTRAFPSASLATATALTVGLWAVQPKGRWLFVALCVGTMLQRTFCGAHFLSDLFGSASVGLAWAYVCFHPSLMGSVFDKMEPNRETRKRRGFSKQKEIVQRRRKLENQAAIQPPAESPDQDDRIAA
jgi:membrane-associated phospholipid phosphatase